MKKYLTLGLILLLHIFLLNKTQFTVWPEIVSSPYLLLHGFTLYKDFIHPYPPLLPLLLTVMFAAIGFNILVLKVIVWITILISDVLIIKIARQLKVSQVKSFLVLLLYIYLQTYLEGNMLWYDTALTLPVLFFTYFLIQKKLFRAFMMILTMCFIKQSAVFSLFVFMGYLIYEKEFTTLKKGLTLIIGCGLIFLVWVFLNSSFIDMYRWVFYYPTHYWSHFPGYVSLHTTRHELFTILILSAPAVMILKIKRYRFMSLFYIASLLAVYPRFSFFHFQPALAWACILFLLCILHTKQKVTIMVYCIALLCVMYITKPYVNNAAAEVRFFTEADYSLATKIQDVIPPNTTIYLLNIPSQQYMLTKTIPPKPWLDNYGWYFEMPMVEVDTILTWSKNPPEYVVWKESDSGNWYDIGVYEPQKLSSWVINNYQKDTQIGEKTWIWKQKN